MEQIETLARVAAAFSDPIRVQIMDILVKGRDASCTSPPHPRLPHALCPYMDVQPKLGNISRSKLSYHLKALREVGLVEEERLGKQVFYLINYKRMEQFFESLKQRYPTSSVPQATT